MSDAEAGNINNSDHHHDDDDGGSTTRRRFDLSNTFSPGVATRLMYASYLFTGLVFCLMLKGSLGKLFGHISFVQEGCHYIEKIKGGTDVDATSDKCFQNSLVYRVSFTLALFFLIHFMSVSDLTCCVDAKSREELQTKYFCIKSALLSLLGFVVFWIPNSFFATYAWVCMFASALFLVIQVILIVDFSYEWNEDWGQRSEENSKWAWYLAIVAFGCYGFGIVMTVVNFYYFVPHQDCNFHAFAITFTVICGIGYTLVAIWVPHGSIVPSGIVFGYTSLLCFSALHNSNHEYCNGLYTPNGSESIKMLVLSAIFSSGALAYTVISTSGAAGRQGLSLQNEEDLHNEDPDESGHLSGYCYFHAIMLMGSLYLAMIATNWSISGNGTNVEDGRENGHAAALWVKLASQWLTIGVYLWTLLAPYFCCSDRDFGYDASDWN